MTASPAVTFAYRAVRSDGAIEQGTIAASSRDDASARLSARGQWVLELHTVRARSGRTLSKADLALGLRLLSSFLDAGMPLGRAIDSLGGVAPERWRVMLPALRYAINAGAPLADAFAEAPGAVPPLVIGVIRAGEAGSGLARAVRQAAELIETEARTRAAIMSALTYPCIVLAAGTVSLGVLVGVVLPRFASLLADLGQTLPTSTRLVLNVTAILQRWALPVSLAATIVAIIGHRWATSADGRPRWHAALLGLPVIGRVRAARATARLASAVAALLEHGVPLAPALRSGAAACGDAAVELRVLHARERIVHGEPIGAALEAQGALTPLTLRFVRAGEASGQLADLLRHAASLEQEYAERIVRGTVRLIEPLLIIGFGVVVAVVAGALLQALYSIRPVA